MKISLEKFLVPEHQMAAQLPNIGRDAIAKACAEVAALNERTAEQALVVEMERRLSVAEGNLQEAHGQLDYMHSLYNDATEELGQLRAKLSEMAVPDAGAAFDMFVAGIGGLDSNAWHDYPADAVFHKGFEAGLAAVPPHSQQSAAYAEFIKEVREARRLWIGAYPSEDGRDCVTPFDRFLYADRCPSHEGPKS